MDLTPDADCASTVRAAETFAQPAGGATDRGLRSFRPQQLTRLIRLTGQPHAIPVRPCTTTGAAARSDRHATYIVATFLALRPGDRRR